MLEPTYSQRRQRLQHLMEQAGISSWRELSERAGVSEWQLIRLQCGLLPKMRLEILWQLAAILQVPVSQMLSLFCPAFSLPSPEEADSSAAELTTFKQEYRRLQQALEQQPAKLRQTFERGSLQVLETLLLQLPTAVAAAEKNPQLPATKLLPLLKPLTELLEHWGVETIGTVGEEVPYNPRNHELMAGSAAAGQPVRVRYVGYRQGETLLYRAKVSPVGSGSFSVA